jgi:alpha-tubulin suppressor-like RCC1 family protein
MPATSYTPSLTDLSHPVITDPAELSFEEIALIKAYVVNTVMPALSAGIVPPSLSGFSYAGSYSATTQYYVNNIISDFGAVYIANLSTKGNPPLAGRSNTQWTLVVPANSTLTSEGDLLYFNFGANARLPIGLPGTKLTSNGLDPAWTLDDSLQGLSTNPNNGTSLFSNAYNGPFVAGAPGALPPPFCSFPNPAMGPVRRPVSRSYTSGFHVWLNKQHEVCFRGTSGAYYFGGTNGTGPNLGTTILNCFSSGDQLTTGEVFVQIHAAFNTILALTNIGNIYAIGNNALGLCGDGTTVEKRLWSKVPTLGPLATWNGLNSPIVAMHVGIGSGVTAAEAGNPCCVFAIDTLGRLFAWGSGALGQLGVGVILGATVNWPTLVTGPWNAGSTIVPVVQIHSSGVHTLLITQAYEVYATGYNGGGGSTHGGALGNGNNTNQLTFIVTTLTGTQVIASADNSAATAGYYATSYIMAKATNQLATTGYNGDGRLGNGTTTVANTWQFNLAITAAPASYMVVAGEGLDSTVYVSVTGTGNTQLYAAGYGGGGQLGGGSTTNSSSFTLLSSVSQFSYVTTATNGVVNTTSVLFGNNLVTQAVPIHCAGAAGAHGVLVLAKDSTNTYGPDWWYLGPQGSLNITPIAEATIDYIQLFPMPVNIANGSDVIVDVINNGQAFGSLNSCVIQTASGKQFAIGSNTYCQYNDSALFQAQFISVGI